MARSQKYGNDTVDALKKGCFDHYDPVACSRISILVLIGAVTLLFVLLKIIKYHAYKHSRIHHYLIFYVSAVQCILCIADSIFGTRHPQLDFTTYYVKLMNFILICHLFWSSAAENRHRDDIIQHVVNPVLCLYGLYLTTVILMGMVDISGTWTECLRPYWLMLSGADFTVVQLFAMVALYLTHDSRRSAISALMLPTIHCQTRDIWLVTVAFEISALVSVIFDSLMIFMGREETGCSGIYDHVQVYYSLLIMIVTILKYMIPMWILLCIFHPIRTKSRPSEVGLTSHYNMERTCENQYRRILFSPNGGLSTSLQYPTIPYTNDSPIYGSFGDFSYTDSMSDISPTIAKRWSIDDGACGTMEKHFVDRQEQRERASFDDEHFTRQNNRQSYDRSLVNARINEEKSDVEKIRTNDDLTTINEESANIGESPRK